MVSWFLVGRDTSGQSVVLGMEGSQKKQELVGTNKARLISFLQRFPGARGFLVARPAGGNGIDASSLLPQLSSGATGTNNVIIPDATWFNFFRDSDSKQPIVVAMKGSQGVEFYAGNQKAELIQFFLRHTQAGNYLVAPASANPPANLPRWDPQSVPNPSWKVLLEIGHGPGDRFRPGARAYDGSTTEHDLNRVAANAARDFLMSVGVDCRVNDDSEGGGNRQDLTDLGRRIAGGFDVFCSVHHNAFNRAAQGAEAFSHRTNGNALDQELAKLIADEISDELKIANRGAKEANFWILTGAEATNVRATSLAEIYFIDDQITKPPLQDFSKRGGVALGRAILKWLQRHP
ncbi:MAG: N-acetylmuramoyl-L-alanine amidase [Cyanobacteria bacterium J06632_22]